MAGVGQSELPSTSATGSKPAEKGAIGFQKCDLTPRKRNRPQTHSDGLLGRIDIQRIQIMQLARWMAAKK
jgi:hypothetical protein